MKLWKESAPIKEELLFRAVEHEGGIRIELVNQRGQYAWNVCTFTSCGLFLHGAIKGENVPFALDSIGRIKLV